MQNVVQKLLLALLLILIFEKSILSYSQSFTFNHTSDEYRLVVTPILNFTNAHATCFSSFGGSLAMFTTLSHYLAVNTLVRTHSAANYYIGATDVVTEGAYLWMDGTPLNFTNWIPSIEPNGGPIENCVEVGGSSDKWNDMACFATRPYLCKRLPCNGLGSLNPNVCGGHGKCIAKDVCNCTGGYIGSFCDTLPSCFGIIATSSLVCSNQSGVCTSNDTCTCNSGFAGAACNISICGGILANNSAVCNYGNGTCTMPSTCVCNSGYTGSSCQIPSCFGFAANDSRVCNMGNGTCIAFNTCQCLNASVYAGPSCHNPVCFGHLNTSTQVCSMKNGSCISPNSCSCQNGYIGNECHIPLCFGLNSTSPNVCSAHGICTRNETCVCNSNYVGNSCQYPICFSFHDANVCSGHGLCQSPNNCNCSTGYSGATCEYPICHSIPATNVSTCSAHGICSSPNNCSCTNDYSGAECQFASCFGLNATNALVCSAHGQCTMPNNCNCTTGWTGIECQIPLCFALNATSTSVCNNRNGSCVHVDTCQCILGYVGPSCSHAVCNNISAIDAQVCSGHGSCLLPNSCKCLGSWVGNFCNVPLCYGISATNSSVCSSHGKCTFPDDCNCDSGYSGSFCSTPICYGVEATKLNQVCFGGNGTCVANNSCICNNGRSGSQCENVVLQKTCFGHTASSGAVCSGHGKCNGPNQCACHQGYFGATCEHISCPALSCNSHGTCIAPNVIQCNNGYSGSGCNVPVCFGISSMAESVVCNGKSACIAPDTCACPENWQGSRNCTHCSPNYSGLNCATKFCNPNTTCSAHGTCKSDMECSCFGDDERGFWSGPFCSRCMPNYFGQQCNQSCNAITFCNNHGSCNSLGLGCECFNDDKNGHFTGQNCSLCASSWYGTQCNIYMSPVFNISERGDQIVGLLRYPTRIEPNLPCHAIFANPSVVTFGIGATCNYEHQHNRVIITLGQNSTALASTDLMIRMIPYSNASYLVATVIHPIVTKPVASVHGYTFVRSCDGAVLDGSLSRSADRKPLKYQWRLTNSPTANEILANFVGNATWMRLTIPFSLFPTIGTYSFSLTVQNGYDVFSLPSIWNTTRPVDTTLSVDIVGPSTLHHRSVSSVLIFQAQAALSSCGAIANLSYLWQQVQGVPLLFPLSAANNKLIIPPFAFPPLDGAQLYTFQVTATLGTQHARSIVNVFVSLGPLSVKIRGGNRMVPARSKLILDGSSSYDPEFASMPSKFTWSCKTTCGSYCDSRNIFVLSENSTILEMQANSLVHGILNFTLMYSKGIRYASTFVLIEVAANALEISLGDFQNIVTNLDVIRLQSIAMPAPERYTWSIVRVADQQQINLTENQLLTRINESNLVINFNVLTAGTSYSIKVLAMSQNITGYAFSDIHVAPLPLQGHVAVSPNVGVAGETEFYITAPQWQSATGKPLLYSFGYYLGTHFVTLTTSTLQYVVVKLPLGPASSNYVYSLVVRVKDEAGNRNEMSTIVTCNPHKTDILQYAQNFQGSLNTLVSMVNSNTLPFVQNSLCINDCSGHGTCVLKTCVCNEGYELNDCRVTTAELRLRTELRYKMIQTLSLALTKHASPSEISDIAVTLAQIVTPIDEMNVQSKLEAAQLVTNIIAFAKERRNSSASGIFWNDDIIIPLLNVVDSLVGPSVTAKNLSLIINTVIIELSNSILAEKLPGEASLNVIQTWVSLWLKKEFANKLPNLMVAISPSSSVVLPNQIDQSHNTIVNIEAIAFNGNPYAYSSSSKNLSSNVVSFSLKDAIGAPIQVQNLNEPVLITIPGTFNTSDFPVGCILTRSNVPICAYWDVPSESWKNDGCKVHLVFTSSIVCACNHLTDFGGLVSQVLPAMNLLSVEEFTARLNPDNYKTFIAMLSMLGLYVFGMVLCFVLDLLFQPKNERDRAAEVGIANMGKMRMILEALRRDHLYISVLLRPSTVKTFTRPQRLTVVFLSIACLMLVSALLFGQTQPTLVKTITGALIANFAAIPVIAVATQLFYWTRIKEAVSEDAIKTIPTVLLNNVGSFELDEFSSLKTINTNPYQLFQTSLNDIMKQSHEDGVIPKKLQDMAQKIEQLASDADLIDYHPSHENLSHYNELVTELNTQEKVDLSLYHVTMIIRAFTDCCQQLPSPVLSHEQFCKLTQSSKNNNAATACEIIASLTEPNYFLLYRVYLMLGAMKNRGLSVDLTAIAFLSPLIQDSTLFFEKDHECVTQIASFMLTNSAQLFAKRTIQHTEQVKQKEESVLDIFKTSSFTKQLSKGNNFEEDALQLQIVERKKRRLSLKSVITKNILVAQLQKVASKAADIGDELLDKIELRLRKLSKADSMLSFAVKICIGLLVCGILYIGAIASILVIMELLFSKLWLRFLTTLLTCMAAILPVSSLEFLYFSQKMTKYKTEKVWHVPKKFLLFVALLSTFVLGTAIAGIVLVSMMKFWTWEHGIEHTVIVLVTLLALFIHGVFFVVLHYRKPKLVLIATISKAKEQPFPAYALLIIYPLVWACIAVMCWLVVQYGIKFGPTKANAWLNSCFFGIAQGIFLMGPLNIALNAIVVNWVVTAIRASFTTLKVQIQDSLPELREEIKFAQ